MKKKWKRYLDPFKILLIFLLFPFILTLHSNAAAFQSENTDLTTKMPPEKIVAEFQRSINKDLVLKHTTIGQVINNNYYLTDQIPNEPLANYYDYQYNFKLKYPLEWKIKYTNYTGYLETISFYDQDQEKLVLYVLENNYQDHNSIIDGMVPALSYSLPGGHNPPQEIIQFSKKNYSYEIQFFPRNDDLYILNNILQNFQFIDDASHLMIITGKNELTEIQPQSEFPQCPPVNKPGFQPHGTVIVPGENWNGVDVFSNGGDINNACPLPNGSTYGWQFQCVELVQRLFAQKWGIQNRWGITYAYEMFDHHEPGTTSYPNGSSTPPVWGDALVFSGGPYGYGHVAVITSVSGGRIYFVEQNWAVSGQSSLAINSSNYIENRGNYSVLGWVHANKNNSGNGGAPQGYVFCTNETGYCGFSGTATIAYGAQGTYIYKNFSNGTDCNNTIFGGDPVPGVQKSCYINGGGPVGYTYCANEGQQCSFSGLANVAYGASLKYIYKDNISGGISCDNNTFGGDPIFGIAKACYYKSQGQVQGTWDANYFTGQTRWWDNSNTSNWQCSSKINSSTYTLNVNYNDGAPCSNGMSGDNWVGDYKATIDFPSNNYVFWIDHDDGMKLWLNGTNIADVGDSGSYWVCPARHLSGLNNLWALLREDGGSAHIILNWSTDTTICDPPFPFSKLMPFQGSIGLSTNPMISWNSSTKADWYEYCVDTNNNNICETKWIQVHNSTSAQLNALSYGTTYYWQVRGVNPYSQPTEADGGVWWSFTIQPNLPSNFNKISPANGSTNQPSTPSLTWGSSSRATEYEYCYDTTNDNACSNWTSSGSNTSISLSGLSSNTTYYWQARAINSAGMNYADGSSTAYWSFTVPQTEQQVRVIDVWIADENWNHKSTFNPGDPIQWVITVVNETGGDAQIELTYDVKGPNGEPITYWNGTVTTASGVWFWGLGGTVPIGKRGTHTFIGSGLYQGTNTNATTTYFVTGSTLIPRIYIPIIIKK